jgi:hypothetical protein
MDNREEFEKFVAQKKWSLSRITNGDYFAPFTWAGWLIWRTRQTEIDELKAEVERLRAEQ